MARFPTPGRPHPVAHRRLVALLLTAAGALLTMATAGALAAPVTRAELGREIRISSPKATGWDSRAAVAHNTDDNEYLVAWTDLRNIEESGADIYYRRVAADGKRLGPDVRLTLGSADDTRPAVGYDSEAHEYLVVWENHRGVSGSRGIDIYGRRVSAAGAKIGGQFRVSDAAATGHEEAPALAYDSADHVFLVVWTDGRNEATTGWDVFGRRVAIPGGPIATVDTRLSNNYLSSHEFYPAVAYNSIDNDYVVVWADSRHEGSGGYEVRGQHVTAAGAPQGRSYRISDTAAVTDIFADTAIAYDPNDNEYLVVWKDDRRETTRGDDIYARQVTSAGAPTGKATRVSGRLDIENDGAPAVAYDSNDGDFLVVWADGRLAGARGLDIYGRHMTALGKPDGPSFRVSSRFALDNETYPDLAFCPFDGTFLVVWEDGRNFPDTFYDIYGRLTG